MECGVFKHSAKCGPDADSQVGGEKEAAGNRSRDSAFIESERKHNVEITFCIGDWRIYEFQVM